MSGLLDVLSSPGLWIGALVGAIASVSLQLLWNRHSHQLAAFRVRVKAAAESRRGQPPSLGGSLATPGSAYPDYFRQQENQVDLAIYELGLRPDIPVMDLLYFEYLRSRLEENSVGTVMIVPWSGWRDDRNNAGEAQIKQRIACIFGSLLDRVTVVTAEMLQERASTVFENHFFEQVGRLGNSEFLRTASSLLGYQFRSYHDINQGHPESHQARSIVEHTVRGWLIYKYVERTYINSSTPPRRIASVMWERELTKLLLLSNIVANYSSVDCSLIIGRTVTYRRGLRRVPLPTYVNNTITAFGTRDDQFSVIARKKRAELRRTNEVLSSILKSRPGLRDLPGWSSNPELPQPEDGLRGDALAVARSLRRVRTIYGNDA